MPYKFSIVVPCYNEEKNVPLVVEKFSKAIKRDDMQVVLVDNGSKDNSAKIMKQLQKKHTFIKIVTVTVNQGYGFGILSGLKEADGEYIGRTHADLQTDPKDVMKAFTIIEKEHFPKDIYIKGWRKKRPLFDQVFSIGMGLFESVYLGEKLYEINAQPNIFHRSFFESRENPPYDFALDLYVLYMAQKKHLDIVRFPVYFPARIHGTSSRNTGLAAKRKFIKRTLTFSQKLKASLKDI